MSSVKQLAQLEQPQVSKLVDKPGFLIVSITPTMLFVHRSLQLPVTDEWYGIVRDLVGDDEPLVRQIVPDPGMMLGAAEHLVYGLEEDMDTTALMIDLTTWTRLSEVKKYAWFHGITVEEAIRELVNAGLSVTP